jgi:hypothetical protein
MADAEQPDPPPADAPSPEDAPPADAASPEQSAITKALVELKRVVDEAAAVAPDSAGAATTAALLKMPVLQLPLDVDSVAAELLAAGSHIRLLQAENKRQKMKIESLRTEVTQLRKEANASGAPAAAGEEG